MRADQERVRKLLTEAITLLCRNSLQYEEEVTVEGLLGITLDKKDIFLVSINEVIESSLKSAKRSHEAAKRSHQADENSCPSSPSSSKKLKRRNSNDNIPTQSQNQLVQPKLEPCDSSFDEEQRLNNTSVEIKVERNEHNNTHNKFNSPQQSHDHYTSSRPSGQSHDRLNDPNSSNSVLNTSHNDADQSSIPSSSDMKIKEENKDEDFACFVIDSDEEENYMDDLSDNSRSNPLPPNASFSEVTNWGSDAGLSAFANSNDPNVMGQFGEFQGDQSKWENFDMSQIPGSSNMSNDGSDPNASFNSQDPNQRGKLKQCPICFKILSNVWVHVTTVHMKIRKYHCDQCDGKFLKKSHLVDHQKRKHSLNDNKSSG